jgi:DNA primase
MAAVDMLALVGSRVELTRRGPDSYFGCCPFHDERTPSFHVRPDEKTYYCFGCSESGDPFNFVMATEGIGFPEALETLANRFGVTLELEEESPEAAGKRRQRQRLFELLDRSASYYERYLWTAREAAGARDYLHERGFSDDLLHEFRVGFAPRSWDRLVKGSRGAGYSDAELLATGLAQRRREGGAELRDRFFGRVMFPTCDARGRVLGFGARIFDAPADGGAGPKYLNTAEGEIYHKREVLYGISLARAAAAKAGHMLLVEGYTDVIALHQAGVRNAVGVMGTSLSAEQVRELVRTVQVLELCLDADSAGQEAMLRAAKLCADSGLELRVVELAPGADPGELLQREGAGALRDAVLHSVPFVSFRVERILAATDVSSAEEKDRAIATLRPVLGEMAPSVLRDELLHRAASQLHLTDSHFFSLLEAAGTRVPAAEGGGVAHRSGAAAPMQAGAGDADAPAEAGRRAAGSPQIRTSLPRSVVAERSFLAMCLAAGETGASTLTAIDPDVLISDPILRAAARYLAGADLRAPLAALTAEQEDLRAVVADLVDRAGRGGQVSGAQLEHAQLLLDYERLRHEIAYQRERGGGLTELAREQQRVREQISTVAARIERAG